MTIAFPDISSYEEGLTIQPGTVAVIAKATEGTYYRDAEYAGFKAQAAAVGAVFSAYHFLKQEGSAADQARYAYAFVGTTPQMLDVETEGSSKPGMVEIMSFISTTKALGGRVWGVYLPRWYWQEIGSPDLTPIQDAGAVLVSSAYTGYSDTGPGWNPYGGVTPTVWQWTDAQPYGGQTVDFNAYRGTVQQLAALINGTTLPAPSSAPAPKPTPTEDDVSFATGTITPGLGPDGQGACTVILPPPANSGGAGWGNVWVSLGSDFGDAHVRVAVHVGGKWTDFTPDLVVPAAGPRVLLVGSPLPKDVEKISITRLSGSENVPLSYLIEAVKA